MSEEKSLGSKFEDFVARSRRLLRHSTKPSSKEYWQLFKVIFLLIVILGLIGFGIRIVMQPIMRPG